ncbi:rod shape-determining protein MreC [Capsulimonas corticalis]|uniref:Cell shape-determining protein MreC n=1 Tax=Capsulimonas corticalis TaxID=2219043 RepID=A0A9N7L727_9BACT|nr:rod shape-determining protein MreC [Capsulimonas corticalis]
MLTALLLCGALNAIHHQRQRRNQPDPVSGVVRDAALIPAQTVTVQVAQWWRMHVGSLFVGPQLAQRNRALGEQVLALSGENKQLLAAQQENNRLRALLNFEQKSPRPLLAAEVTALKPVPHSETITLNRGSTSGVKLRTIAIAPNGALIGQVLDVSSRSCTVLMLTDAGSSVGAQVRARGVAKPPIGVCQGTGDSIHLTYLKSDDDVRPGDLVTTSGLGGVFPADIPIGTVVSIQNDATRSIKTAVVRPNAYFDSLEEAFLIR